MAMDPGAQRVLDLLREAGRPPIELSTPPEAREAMAKSRTILQPDPPEVAEVRALEAPGPAGAIPLRYYRGKGAPVSNAPALVYFHGGGWVIGDLESHDGACRRIANDAGCVVVSVDYRLAPEHRFPAAVDDSAAATKWVIGQAASLGIDASRVAVGGDSAGGNLAAVVALMSRNGELPKLSFQALVYPSTDMAGHYPVLRADGNRAAADFGGYALVHRPLSRRQAERGRLASLPPARTRSQRHASRARHHGVP